MDPRIRSFQSLAFVGGLIIAAFALVIRAPGMEVQDPLWLRLGMTTLCWGGGIALSVVPWARRHFEHIAHTVIAAVTLWQLHLIWINDLAVTKVLGLLIVVVVCILGFRDVRALGIYGVTVVVLGIATSMVVPDPAVSPVYLIATLSTITTMGFVMLRARLRLETELRQSREKAEASDAAKSVYVATMSHEIRTPVNAMVGMADVLLETDLDADQQEVADSIYRAGQALSALIDNVLDFSKIEAGQVELEARPIALRSLFDTLMGLVAQQARARGVDLVVHMEQSVPDTIIGDPTRVQQIVMNLLANAVKFTREGYVLLHADAAPQLDGTYTLSITVRDTGKGIPAERHASIFSPYQQADVSTTRHYGGTGLGLTIVRQLVDLMGGTISLESKLGQGSAFRINLPVEGRRIEAAAWRGDQLLLAGPRTPWHTAFLSLAERWNAPVMMVETPNDLTSVEGGASGIVLAVEPSSLNAWRASIVASGTTGPIVVIPPMGGPDVEALPGETVMRRPIRASRLEAVLKTSAEVSPAPSV